MTTLFHETLPENELSILRDGFRDESSVTRADGSEIRGVWVADRPIRNRPRRVTFQLECDFSEADLAGWHPYRDRPDFREWLVPATRLNDCRLLVIERT